MKTIIDAESKKIEKLKANWLHRHKEDSDVLNNIRRLLILFQTYDDSSEDKVQVLTELEKFMGKLRSSIDTYRVLLDDVVGIVSSLNEKGRNLKSEDFKTDIETVLALSKLKKVCQEYQNDLENKESVINSIDYEKDDEDVLYLMIRWNTVYVK